MTKFSDLRVFRVCVLLVELFFIFEDDGRFAFMREQNQGIEVSWGVVCELCFGDCGLSIRVPKFLNFHHRTLGAACSALPKHSPWNFQGQLFRDRKHFSDRFW